MIRILPLLINVTFLNGCFLSSVDCDAVADVLVFNEDFSQLNNNEKIIARQLKLGGDIKLRHKTYVRRCMRRLEG
jgi:hypothetical protein